MYSHIALGDRFAMDLSHYYCTILGENIPDPTGPLTTPFLWQAFTEVGKQVHATVITRVLKKRGSGHFDMKTVLRE